MLRDRRKTFSLGGLAEKAKISIPTASKYKHLLVGTEHDVNATTRDGEPCTRLRRYYLSGAAVLKDACAAGKEKRGRHPR